MTAPTWPSVVAAVPHDVDECAVLCGGTVAEPGCRGPCDCTRDARIGAGIAAVRESDTKYHDGGRGHDDCSACEQEEADARDAAAVAAFREATVRAKEEGI